MAEGEQQRFTKAQLIALRIGAENNIKSRGNFPPPSYWQGVYDVLGLILGENSRESSSLYVNNLNRLAEEVWDDLMMPRDLRYERFKDL